MRNKFQELLSEVLSETKLFEMAFSRQKAIDVLKNNYYQILKHFIKIAIFPNSKDVPHWKQELEAWLSEVDDLYIKPRGRKLKYEDYWEWLYDGPIGHEDALENIIHKMFKRDKIEVDYKKLHIKFEKMYTELCDDLSIDKFEDIDYYCDMLKD